MFFFFFILGFIAALVARQFTEVSRAGIEGLLAAFPRLVGSGKQHTYVETDKIRYVYQPLEGKAASPSIIFFLTFRVC